MNRVILTGRLTKEPKLSYSGEKAFVKFSLAVDKKYKREGQPTADFFDCVAFGKTAETIDKYCNKGTKIGVDGSIQTGSYTNREGRKVYTTSIVVDSFEFMTSKSDPKIEAPEEPKTEEPQFEPIDEELPFV